MRIETYNDDPLWFHLYAFNNEMKNHPDWGAGVNFWDESINFCALSEKQHYTENAYQYYTK